MTDENVLSEYNIDEKKFIVVMVTKPKSTPAPYAGPSDPTAIPDQSEEGKQKETAAAPTERLVYLISFGYYNYYRPYLC